MSTLMRFAPIEQLRSGVTRFQQEMDRLFERWGLQLPHWPALAVSYPALNIWEDDTSVHVEGELPGLKLEDLDILVTGDDQLTIKGKREKPKEPKGAIWHRQERGFGDFSRVITLPAPVNASKVDARFEQGVLTIKMAKSEAAKAKKIPVKGE
jgi:HSP20 family protein